MIMDYINIINCITLDNWILFDNIVEYLKNITY